MSSLLIHCFLAQVDCRKTELLLELAFRCRGVCNIFFVRAHDAASLDRAFLEFAMSIGHDILAPRYPGTDLHAIWLQLSPSDRIDAFRKWIGEQINQPSLFIVDDIDGINEDKTIQAALPREAKTILFSTRDPSIVDSLSRECEELRIPPMDVDELAALIAFVTKRSKALHVDITEQELEAIAKVVEGHALGACRAISYIIHVLAQTAEDRPVISFLAMISGTDWKARLKFLHYRPRFGQSILETFEVSLKRLRKHQAEAVSLLELIAFLSDSDNTLDFRRFLGIDRPWLTHIKGRLTNFETFKNGLSDKNEILAELENVSIGFRPSLSKPLRLHPLWTECVLQRAGHEARCSWLVQILQLCYVSSKRQEHIDILHPFALNCTDIAKRFDIDIDRITESEELSAWVRMVGRLQNNEALCEEVEATTGAEDRTLPPSGVKGNHEAGRYIHPMIHVMESLCEDSKKFQISLASHDQEVFSPESHQSLVNRFKALLGRLRNAEEALQNENIRESRFQQAHVKTYDWMIKIMPFLNTPIVLDQLCLRKQSYTEQYGI